MVEVDPAVGIWRPSTGSYGFMPAPGLALTIPPCPCRLSCPRPEMTTQCDRIQSNGPRTATRTGRRKPPGVKGIPLLLRRALRLCRGGELDGEGARSLARRRVAVEDFDLPQRMA